MGRWKVDYGNYDSPKRGCMCSFWTATNGDMAIRCTNRNDAENVTYHLNMTSFMTSKDDI